MYMHDCTEEAYKKGKEAGLLDGYKETVFRAITTLEEAIGIKCKNCGHNKFNFQEYCPYCGKKNGEQ